MESIEDNNSWKHGCFQGLYYTPWNRNQNQTKLQSKSD